MTQIAAAFAAPLLMLATVALLPHPATAAGPPDLADYRLTFSTDFNKPLRVSDHGPFTTRYEEWGGLRTLTGNQEQELYVDPDFVPSPAGTDARGHDDAPLGSAPRLGYDPFQVHDGQLDIVAIPAPPQERARIDRPYLSGMLSTEWSFAQHYGYFAMRARLPHGRGLWPAFWLVSKTQAEHIEIDIVEALGHDDTHVYQSTHITQARGTGIHLKVTRPGFKDSDGMHVYSLNWTADALVFYIDGVETARTDGAPFRTAPPMYMIANLAVGGSWGGNPDATTHFPAVMRIDYIRAYAAK